MLVPSMLQHDRGSKKSATEWAPQNLKTTPNAASLPLWDFTLHPHHLHHPHHPLLDCPLLRGHSQEL